ncbi:DnaA/Hda family protein [Novosphingobium sp. SL115]|uniref:HdaA/DnaA family protein n=1 Tax=Novosphingobium sp. SL115 TaxID=2995150 RepID=UPI002273AE76|nr:DnaA/Hda family protein [Novosphingobium sp. SL115]MCY1671099.1 DnaA/Hda family protein [Novosphingobium sp. SL115]
MTQGGKTSQIALPLVTARGAETIVTGPSLVPVIDALMTAERWPFRTALLTGPPRSGKSLLARWFAESGAGEVVDGADSLPEDEVFHRWNRAQADGRPLLLVCDRAPGEWKIALPDLASRLGAALLIEVGAPDDELLAGLIVEHAARRGLILGEAVLAYLLQRVERSHAGIELLIETLDRLSLERKAPVTISLVRDALAERTGEFQPRLL